MRNCFATQIISQSLQSPRSRTDFEFKKMKLEIFRCAVPRSFFRTDILRWTICGTYRSKLLQCCCETHGFDINSVVKPKAAILSLSESSGSVSSTESNEMKFHAWSVRVWCATYSSISTTFVLCLASCVFSKLKLKLYPLWPISKSRNTRSTCLSLVKRKCNRSEEWNELHRGMTDVLWQRMK